MFPSLNIVPSNVLEKNQQSTKSVGTESKITNL